MNLMKTFSLTYLFFAFLSNERQPEDRHFERRKTMNLSGIICLYFSSVIIVFLIIIIVPWKSISWNKYWEIVLYFMAGIIAIEFVLFSVALFIVSSGWIKFLAGASVLTWMVAGYAFVRTIRKKNFNFQEGEKR